VEYKFTPYSKNVIFLDTEFSTSEPYNGEILSIGLVKLNGDELYLELEYEGPTSDWVKEKILTTLNKKKISRDKAVKVIRRFVGKNRPYIVAHFSPYDFIYLNKLFGTSKPEQIPFKWVPVDFMSIFFAKGMNPETMIPKNKRNIFYKNIGIDVSKFTIHKALDDAKLLREVYIKMTK